MRLKGRKGPIYRHEKFRIRLNHLIFQVLQASNVRVVPSNIRCIIGPTVLGF
jgi:hypothetical protein